MRGRVRLFYNLADDALRVLRLVVHKPSEWEDYSVAVCEKWLLLVLPTFTYLNVKFSALKNAILMLKSFIPKFAFVGSICGNSSTEVLKKNYHFHELFLHKVCFPQILYETETVGNTDIFKST